MKKWNDREFNTVEWVIKYISPGSVEKKYRDDIRRLKEKPAVQHVYYSREEKAALCEAISYFEEFYKYSVNGMPKGNKTVAGVLERLEYLKSAREKLMAGGIPREEHRE